MADACVAWVIQGDALVERARRFGPDHFGRLTGRDWRWGTATARERLLHRLGVVTGVAAHLPGVAALARDTAAAIRSRWPRLSAIPATGDRPLSPAPESRQSSTAPQAGTEEAGSDGFGVGRPNG